MQPLRLPSSLEVFICRDGSFSYPNVVATQSSLSGPDQEAKSFETFSNLKILELDTMTPSISSLIDLVKG